jgi:hypothetical protein
VARCLLCRSISPGARRDGARSFRIMASSNNHQGRTRQQCLRQCEIDEHGPAQAGSLPAAVWRIPHAVVCLCVPRRHIRRAPAIRGNLSERSDGRSHARRVSRTRRGHAEGVESSPGQPVSYAQTPLISGSRPAPAPADFTAPAVSTKAGSTCRYMDDGNLRA